MGEIYTRARREIVLEPVPPPGAAGPPVEQVAHQSALYARVSTTGQTTQQQLDRLRGVAPGAAEFVDDAVSGRLAQRPEFDRLTSSIERGEVRVLYVCKIDRLGRSAKAVLEFFDLAERCGCRIVVTDQGVDTSSPVGRVVRTILAALAELEADLTRERTQAAMDAFRTGTRTPKGRVGRPPRVTEDLLREIRRLRDEEHLQWSRVAVRLHVPASSARKWYSNSSRPKGAPPPETPRVINEPGAFGADPPDRESVPCTEGPHDSGRKGTDSSRDRAGGEP